MDSSGNRQVGGKSPKAEVVSAAKTVFNSSGEPTIIKLRINKWLSGLVRQFFNSKDGLLSLA